MSILCIYCESRSNQFNDLLFIPSDISYGFISKNRYGVCSDCVRLLRNSVDRHNYKLKKGDK